MSNNVISIVIQAVDKGVQKVLSGVRSGVDQTNKASQAYHQTLQSLNGTADHFRSTMAQIIATIGGAQIFGAAGRQAIQFNSTIEQSQIGIAALIRAFADAEGGSVGMAESMQTASEIQKQLQLEGLKTTATYQELLEALQEGIGPALKAGFNPEQIVKFTSLMTQAAAALSVPMNQLGQEIRSILEGTIDQNSRVAKALGISNEKVKELAAQGKLFDYLSSKLRAFGEAGDAMGKTLGGTWSNLIDAMQMALGNSLAKSFSGLTAFLSRLKDAIVTVDEATGQFTFNEKIVQALKTVDEAVTKVLDSFSSEQLGGMLASFVEMMGTIAVAVLDFVTSLARLWQGLGPFAPAVAGIVVQFTLWGTAIKAMIGLPLELMRQIAGLNAGFAALAGGSLPLFIRHVQEGSAHTGLFRTALASLPNVLATISAAMAAFAVGWAIGTLLSQFDIVKKAGVATAHALTMGWLRVREAWAKLTGGDTEAIQREMENSRRAYTEMMNEIDGKAAQSADTRVKEEKKVTEAAKSSASTIKQATGDALKEMQKRYKEYADEIRRIQADIANRERSLTAELRAMARSGMSGVSAWEDQRKEAQEYEAAAKKAAAEAKAAMAAGDTITAGEKWKEAVGYADEAKQAYKALNTEVKSGDTVVVSQQEALKTAMDGVKSSGELAISILKQQQDAANGAMNALTEKSGFANLAKGMDEAEQKWLESWQNMRSKAEKELVVVEEHIEKIVNKDRTVYINVKTVESRSSGGMVGGYSLGGAIQALASGGGVRNILGGGHLPGFGGGDVVNLLGEAGEFMINKWASLKAGLPALAHLNNGRIDLAIVELSKRIKANIGYRLGGLVGNMPQLPVQHLATGGPVSGGADFGTLNLEFPGGTSVPVMTTRESARALVREFTRLAQRSSR